MERPYLPAFAAAGVAHAPPLPAPGMPIQAAMPMASLAPGGGSWPSGTVAEGWHPTPSSANAPPVMAAWPVPPQVQCLGLPPASSSLSWVPAAPVPVGLGLGCLAPNTARYEEAWQRLVAWQQKEQAALDKKNAAAAHALASAQAAEFKKGDMISTSPDPLRLTVCLSVLRGWLLVSSCALPADSGRRRPPLCGAFAPRAAPGRRSLGCWCPRAAEHASARQAGRAAAAWPLR